jgi:hypothetical protein
MAKHSKIRQSFCERFCLIFGFLIGVLGWWPYFIKNITEGINAILTRILIKEKRKTLTVSGQGL